MDIRVGMGHDIHALVADRDLWLGGVKIPYDQGLLGHSDADALLHAVMDAILGALALGDIGALFPDTDSSWKDASSVKMLKMVVDEAHKKGYMVSNLDCMIHCEAPRLAKYKGEMAESIARVLGVETARISIKAGTNEGFDAVGKRQAISCQAVVLMIKN